MFNKLLLFAIAAFAAHAQNWSVSGLAGINSWNTNWTALQTPGWTTAGHPVGALDVQYKHVYCELAGDPHRYTEASSVLCGLRGDLVHVTKRVSVYGQVAAGFMEAPSFLEYCWSYEYQDGNCGAGAKPPENCPWFAMSAGFGVRVRVSKHVDLLPVRFEYIALYALSPRERVMVGVTFH